MAGDLIDVALDDPAFYAGDPYPTYARLRRQAPVMWHASTGFWAVSKYKDVRYVFRHPELFSSAHGVSIGEKKLQRDVPYRYTDEPFPPADAVSILNADPPAHTAYRKALLSSGTFSPGWAERLEPVIRVIVRDALDVIQPGEPVDAVESIAVPVAVRTALAVFGLSVDDASPVREWSDAVIDGDDPLAPDDLERAMSATKHLWAYVEAQLDQRSETDHDDGLSRLYQASLAAGIPDRPSFLLLVADILVAGQEGPRQAIAGGLSALAGDGTQWDTLRSSPEFSTSAIEEILRFISPNPTFCRTATQDTSIRDVPVAAGDYVVLLLDSANRDEEIWDDAERFDVTRDPVPTHVSFGHGIHLCLGVPLTRVELRVLFDELSRRFRAIRPAEVATQQPSTMTRRYQRVPLVFQS